MTVVVTQGETGEGVVETVRELMGPADVNEAKEQNPERSTLRVFFFLMCKLIFPLSPSQSACKVWDKYKGECSPW